MTSYQVMPLVPGVLAFALFLVAAKRDWRRTVNRLFLLSLAGMTFWGYAIAGVRLSTHSGDALWYEKIALVMISLTTMSFYLFIRRYTGFGSPLSGRLAVLLLLTTMAIAPTDL